MNAMTGLHRPPPSNGTLANGSLAETKTLLVVDRRIMIGRCLCLWLGALGPSFHPVSVDSLENPPRNDVLNHARVVILCTASAAPCEDAWLLGQIAWARKNLPDVPLVLLAEAPDAHLAETAVRQLQLGGYIPTSSSLELAATALRLIIAGGRYIPQECHDGDRPVRAAPGLPPSPSAPASASCVKLTIRERSVLDLLERGLPNKIISYQLGMSQSTVKVHVHNIIAKLKVRNRTEAAVARYATLVPPVSFAPLPPASLIDPSRTAPLAKAA